MFSKNLLMASDPYAIVTFNVDGLIGEGQTQFLVKKGSTLSEAIGSFPKYDYEGNYTHGQKWYFKNAAQIEENRVYLSTTITESCTIVCSTTKYDAYPSSGKLTFTVSPASYTVYNVAKYGYGYWRKVMDIYEVYGSVSVSGDTSYFNPFVATTEDDFGIFTECDWDSPSYIYLRARFYLTPRDDVYFKTYTKVYLEPEFAPKWPAAEADFDSSYTYRSFSPYVKMDHLGFTAYRTYRDTLPSQTTYPFLNGNTINLCWGPVYD